MHSFIQGGAYTIALNVTNATRSNTLIRTNYIIVNADKIGVFRPSTHNFTLDFNGNGIWEGAEIDREYDFGITGDIPSTGDWEGNGITEVGVFRPSNHTFYLRNAGYPGVPATAINWGLSTNLPVTGDWDGVSPWTTEVGVFRPSTHRFYLRSAGYPANPAIVSDWGLIPDLPVTGDWNVDGITDIGVFRPSTHIFYLKNGTTLSWTTTTINWGASTESPGHRGLERGWYDRYRSIPSIKPYILPQASRLACESSNCNKLGTNHR